MKKWSSMLALVIALVILSLASVAYAENDTIDPTATPIQVDNPAQ